MTQDKTLEKLSHENDPRYNSRQFVLESDTMKRTEDIISFHRLPQQLSLLSAPDSSPHPLSFAVTSSVLTTAEQCKFSISDATQTHTQRVSVIMLNSTQLSTYSLQSFNLSFCSEISKLHQESSLRWKLSRFKKV